MTDVSLLSIHCMKYIEIYRVEVSLIPMVNNQRNYYIFVIHNEGIFDDWINHTYLETGKRDPTLMKRLLRY